jgi:hypothetical protein
MSFSVIFSFGKYGGFYLMNRECMKRICLGWIAITLITPECDEVFHVVMDKGTEMIETAYTQRCK